MTSEERHEARYQRRKQKRLEKCMQRSRQCGDFEDIFSYKNLYHSGKLCCKGVNWKTSTQLYHNNIITNTVKLEKSLKDGTFRSKGFTEFDLCERGKMRHIRSVHISERVVQRTLCDKAIIPTFMPALIYDNGASMKNKGIDFTLNRVTCHLQRHYRKYGSDGYILLYDFSSYFDNAKHEPVKQELDKRIHDVKTIKLANYFLDAFGDVGYGLGSQISQIAAIMLPNKLDHFIKEELKIKGYARYMDDGYLIHHNKPYLKQCLKEIVKICDELGVILNPKKVKIKKLSDGFDFLKVRFKLTETGKVVRKMNYESIKSMRRKLKKFKNWNENGRKVFIEGKYIIKDFPLSDVCSSYASWKAHMKRGCNYWAVKRMDILFESLFDINPNNGEQWKMAINPKGGC